jgi:hypothetical protein
VPTEEWQGLRVNLELLYPNDPYWGSPPAENNLQTFLVVLGEGGGSPAWDLSSGQSMTPELDLRQGYAGSTTSLSAMQKLTNGGKQ